MSATVAPSHAARAGQIRTGRWLAGCAVLAAATLVIGHETAYDPTAWLIWGRQLAEGTISTSGGPSFKPFGVLVTTPAALLGDTAAQLIWMWTARFGGLAALVFAATLTYRLGGGRAEALTAVAALALATDWAYNVGRGDSEGLLVAFVFAALIAGLDGRLYLALGFGVLAAMIRPEAGPLLLIYGLWLLWHRRRPLDALVLGGAAVLLVAVWVVPEQLGSGSGLRAATRAQHPVEGSPGQSAFPFGMAIVTAAIMLCWPVYLGALARVRDAWRARPRDRSDRVVLWIALGSSVAMLEVAIGAEIGFTGKLRYATLPASVLCVLGGLGLPGLVRRARGLPSRAVRTVLAVLAAASVVFSLGILVHGGVRLAAMERRYADLTVLIDNAGGPAAIRACGPLTASPFERQIVAWRLRVDPALIATERVATSGTLLSVLPTSSTLPLRDRVGRWERRAAC